MTGNSRWDLDRLSLEISFQRPALAGHTSQLVSVSILSAVYKTADGEIHRENPKMAYTDSAEETPPCEADKSNSLFPTTACGCFRLTCFGSRRSVAVGPSWWERIRASQVHSDGRWWSRGVRALLKLREWSEIVAGPRWKTFIRRFNRNRSGGGGGSGGGARPGKFQYDPLSYAMNFDEGSAEFGELDDDIDDFSGFRNFSARYASIPPPLKTGGTTGFGKDVSTVA